MKHPSNRSVLKKDYQRLQEWRERACPYCGSKNILRDGTIKEIWQCIDCGVENYFSGKIVERVK